MSDIDPDGSPQDEPQQGSAESQAATPDQQDEGVGWLPAVLAFGLLLTSVASPGSSSPSIMPVAAAT